MPENLQLALWALAVYAPLLLNILTKRDADSVGIAGLLLAGWCLSRIVSMFYSVPDSMRFYPVQDVACVVVIFGALLTRPAWWKGVLTVLFMFQLCLHATFWSAWDLGHSDALPFYRAANNGTFALELLTVGWGAIVDAASHVVRRVPFRSSHLHLRKAGPT